MPYINVGRYSGRHIEYNDKFNEDGYAYCRSCGKLLTRKNWRYCNEKCRMEWWKKVRPYVWPLVRLDALKRDNYKCVVCGEHADEVHHIKLVKHYPELEFDMDNLQSLCHKHHTHKGMFKLNPRKYKKLDEFV